MSIRCQTWVYEHSEATGNDRLVLLAIADEADDDGTNGYPGIDRISHKARVPKRTTMRCIDRLEAAGHLVVHRPEVKGRGHFNTYVVVMHPTQKGATLAPPTPPEKGREKARKGAQPYLIGTRPIDPLTPNDTETTTRATDPMDDFERFYQAFPRKVAKANARTAWRAAVKVADPQLIIAGALRYAADANLPTGADVQFIPHPATWLRGERWGDPPLPPRTNGRTPPPGPSRLGARNSDLLRNHQPANDQEF